MRWMELRGPDAAETHDAWARRWRRLEVRLERAARAVRRRLWPARRGDLPQLALYAEAGAPEGALPGVRRP
ncbi:MAG: hypothetical protein QM788_01080 [Roseateles sp.]|uniref:hypothetical protein n=1 Tax=Roseateles sp. TaxID=1971397 RepID=UPI0039EC7AC6